MTATQSSSIQLVLAVLMAMSCAYLGGRVHQWYRQGQDRDSAFRAGYDRIAHQLITRSMKRTRQRAATEPARIASTSVEAA